MSGHEEWRPIPQFPGYEASSRGQIRSSLRGAPRLLRLSMGSDGYLLVTPYRDGKQFNGPVHQLVTAAFHGPRPEGMEEVRHLDGDRYNNAASNLRYGTRAQNEQDKVRHGTSRSAMVECSEGHPFDNANTYQLPNGGRECRACRRARQYVYRQRRVAA